MGYPRVTTVSYILRFANTVMTQLPDGRWVPARGIGYPGLANRFRCAWLVLTGRADALIWEQQ